LEKKRPRRQQGDKEQKHLKQEEGDDWRPFLQMKEKVDKQQLQDDEKQLQEAARPIQNKRESPPPKRENEEAIPLEEHPEEKAVQVTRRLEKRMKGLGLQPEVVPPETSGTQSQREYNCLK